MSTLPPYYVLLHHRPALAHPAVHYHYADDDPRDLLPHNPRELLLVLDYHPAATPSPSAQSLSPDLAVTALRVAPAPGAGIADDDSNRNRNPNMYIIETTSVREDTPEDDEFQSANAILARFKQTNAILRRALDYSDSSAQPLAAVPPGLSPQPR